MVSVDGGGSFLDAKMQLSVVNVNKKANHKIGESRFTNAMMGFQFGRVTEKIKKL